MSIFDWICLAEALAIAVLTACVICLIWRSDHPKDPRPPKPPKLPHGRHARDDHERIADTTDFPADDVEWFRSLRQPRKPLRPVDLTRDVIPAPVFDPEYAPAPVWPTIFDPVVREDIVYETVPVPAPPLEPLPDGEVAWVAEGEAVPVTRDAYYHNPDVWRPAAERPVPASAAAIPPASECAAGTGLPPGELAPWVAETLRGTDAILDSICARAVTSGA